MILPARGFIYRRMYFKAAASPLLLAILFSINQNPPCGKQGGKKIFGGGGEWGGDVTFFSEESNKEPVLWTGKLLE